MKSFNFGKAYEMAAYLPGRLLTLLVLGCTGAPKQLPPRTPPARVAPAVALPTGAPAPGYARVVLGTTDGPMRIEARGDLAFASATEKASRFGELCTTPCVVDLPAGKYKLYLTSPDHASSAGDVDVINVREGMNYYVRAPGKFEPPQWLHIWPSVLATAGVVTLGVGTALTFNNNSPQQTAGIALMAGGIAVTTAGGILIYDASRGSTQDGATTAWWEPAAQR